MVLSESNNPKLKESFLNMVWWLHRDEINGKIQRAHVAGGGPHTNKEDLLFFFAIYYQP
jgi:hypothetical protein